LIHGGDLVNGTSSEGCIVESPAARSVIGGSGVPILQVEQ